VVLLAWCDDPADPQHAISTEALQLLEAETDTQGRQLQVGGVSSGVVARCLLTAVFQSTLNE
jgi:agmatine/peptidylarginine deiminase